MMMIHNAWTYASGNADQLRKAADDIERINKSMVQHYLTRAGDKLDEDTLKQLLDAETWLSAEEAMGYGLCDEIISANNAAACLDEKWMKEYKNVPQQLANAQANIPSNEMLERQKIAEEAKANADYIKTILGGMHL
ncbi:ATP-dependent Clp protease proteolytic subunit [Bacillus cereus BDRD-ST26]|nr:ATP-dependent Clp protease proteolytic subunit [Bacillus cereus BDRD-ST26]